MEQEGYRLPSQTYSRQKSALAREHAHQHGSKGSQAGQTRGHKNHELIRSIDTINGCRLYILKSRTADVSDVGSECKKNAKMNGLNSQQNSEAEEVSPSVNKSAADFEDASSCKSDTDSMASTNGGTSSVESVPSPTAKSPVKHSTLNPKASKFVLKEHQYQMASEVYTCTNAYLMSGAYVDSAAYVNQKATNAESYSCIYTTACNALQVQNGYSTFTSGEVQAVPGGQPQHSGVTVPVAPDMHNGYTALSYPATIQNGYQPHNAGAVQNTFVGYKNSSPCVSPQANIYANGAPLGKAIRFWFIYVFCLVSHGKVPLLSAGIPYVRVCRYQICNKEVEID